jgi:hypothetical protein
MAESITWVMEYVPGKALDKLITFTGNLRVVGKLFGGPISFVDRVFSGQNRGDKL